MRILLTATVALFGIQEAGVADSTGNAMVVIPHDNAKFVPLDPKRPEIAQLALLNGDPATGPSEMLLSMGGGEGRRHIHSSDYRLVVIEGQMRHWKDVADRAAAPVLGPGSYWFQPANLPHGDDCLSDRCLMFISWMGKRDAKLAE